MAPGPDPETWLHATVTGVASETDVAVMSVAAGSGLAPARYGRLEATSPCPVRTSLDEPGRQPEHAWGDIWAITQAPAGKLGLTLRSPSPKGRSSGSG